MDSYKMLTIWQRYAIYWLIFELKFMN